jgi:hypothetical protein
LTYCNKRRAVREAGMATPFPCNTLVVLETAEEAEMQASHKKGRRQPRKQIDSVKIDSDEEEVFENSSSEDESDCISVAMSS